MENEAQQQRIETITEELKNTQSKLRQCKKEKLAERFENKKQNEDLLAKLEDTERKLQEARKDEINKIKHFEYSKSLSDKEYQRKNNDLEKEKLALQLRLKHLAEENEGMKKNMSHQENKLEYEQQKSSENFEVKNRGHQSNENKREKSNLVSEYNVEISELKQKTTDLRKRIDHLSKENDTLKDISKQNDKRSSNEMNLLQKRLQITEMELTDTNTKLQKDDHDLKEQYETINSTLQVEKHELEACNTDLQSKIGRMKQDIVILKNRHESDRNALQKKMHRKEKELEETRQELDNLKKSETLYDSKILNLVQAKHDLEACKADLEKKSDKMTIDIKTLQQRLDSDEKRRPTFADYDALQQKLHRTEKDLKQTKQELEDTKTRLQKNTLRSETLYHSKIFKLVQAKHDLEACKADLEKKSDKMMIDIKNLQHRLESDQRRGYAFAEDDAFQQKLNRTEKKLKQTELELEDTKTRYSEDEVNINREIAGLRSQLAVAMTELQQMKKEARETLHAAKNDTIDADTYRDELSRLQLCKIDFEKHVETLLKDNEKLKTDIDRQRQAYEIKSVETATKLAYMERRSQKFKDELDKTRTRYSEDELNMLNEIAGLQSKLADAEATLLQMKKESSETMHAAKNKNNEADTKYRNELSRLQQSKLDLETFIETLLKENEKLKIDIDKQGHAYETKSIETTSKLKNMERNGQKLKDELDGTRTRLLEISEGETYKGEQIVELQTMLFDVEKTFHQTSKSYKEQIKALENENSKKASEYSNEVSKLKQKTSDLRRHVEELTKENDTLRDLSKQNDKQSSDKIETLKKRLHSTQMKLTDTIAKLQKEEHSSQALYESKIAILQQEKHKLEDSKGYLQTEIEQMKKYINELKNRLDSDYGDLQKQLHLKENDLKETELELEKATTRFSEEEVSMKNEIVCLRANLVEMQATLQQMKRGAEERILAFENKKSDADAQYNAELTRFQQHKILLEKHVEQLLKENAECKTDIDRHNQTFEKMLIETNSRFEKMERNCQKCNNELDETKSRMRKISEDHARKNTEIEKLQTSLANVEQKFQETRKDSRGNTKQIESEKSNLVSDHKKEVSRFQQNINDMKRHIEDLSTENDKLKSSNKLHKKRSSNDIDTLKQRLESTEMDLLDARKKLQKEKEKNDSQAMYETTILKEEKRKLEVCKADLETKNGQMKRDIINLENILGSNQKSSRYSDCNYDALQKQLRRKEKELKDTAHELEDTKTRLGKCMQHKQVNSNPNIADLSDIHRPTRLADRFQELYDNRWTDAFETLKESNICEKDIIRMLLTIVTQTKHFCDGQSEQQIEDIKKAITQSDEVRQQGIPDNVMKYIKDFRKDSFAEISDNVYKKYQRWLPSDAVAIPKYVVELKDYTKECFELCWLIAIQDQRIVFSPEPKHDDTFQSDVYKLYTVQGTLVDFLVWPALRLRENGPLLSKGVVQAQIPSGGEVGGRTREAT